MKTQNPLIGKSRKSYGDATFYTLNGENIVRTKPMVVANPNTPAQQAQRTRFKGFTGAANSLSEANLNLIFKTTEKGRNRRSILQAQLAPAYGSQPSTDPTSAERYEVTFDVSKIDKIGSGPVGYVGELVRGEMNEENVRIANADLVQMKANMQLSGDETHVFLCGISEDGCILGVSNPVTMEQLDTAIEDTQALNWQGLGEMTQHGDICWCYAFGGKLQLIGLGTFSVAERPARKGHNPKHNVPV